MGLQPRTGLDRTCAASVATWMNDLTPCCNVTTCSVWVPTTCSGELTGTEHWRVDMTPLAGECTTWSTSAIDSGSTGLWACPRPTGAAGDLGPQDCRAGCRRCGDPSSLPPPPRHPWLPYRCVRGRRGCRVVFCSNVMAYDVLHVRRRSQGPRAGGEVAPDRQSGGGGGHKRAAAAPSSDAAVVRAFQCTRGGWIMNRSRDVAAAPSSKGHTVAPLGRSSTSSICTTTAGFSTLGSVVARRRKVGLN